MSITNEQLEVITAPFLKTICSLIAVHEEDKKRIAELEDRIVGLDRHADHITKENRGLMRTIEKQADEIEFHLKRIRRLDIIFHKNILAMQAAVIEFKHGEGVHSGMNWIIDALAYRGEFAPEDDKDAQEFFVRESAILNKEFDEIFNWLTARDERIELERMAVEEEKNEGGAV